MAAISIYRSTIHGDQDGQTIDVIMGWLDGTTTSVTRAQNLADAIRTEWVGNLLPLLVDDYAVTSVEVVGVDDPTIIATNTSGATGASTGGPLPEFVVGNVKLSTGVRGRSFQGRFGIPGLPAAVLDSANGNLFSSSALGSYQTAVEDFVNALLGAGINREMAVISTISGGTPRPSPIATAVTTVELQPAFGSRVSRKG